MRKELTASNDRGQKRRRELLFGDDATGRIETPLQMASSPNSRRPMHGRSPGTNGTRANHIDGRSAYRRRSSHADQRHTELYESTAAKEHVFRIRNNRSAHELTKEKQEIPKNLHQLENLNNHNTDSLNR